METIEVLMEQWQHVRFESADNFWSFLHDDWVTRLDRLFESMRQMDQSEEHQAQLQSLGVKLHAPIIKAKVAEPPVRARESIWREESFWLDLLDTVAERGDTKYFDRVIQDAAQARRMN